MTFPFWSLTAENRELGLVVGTLIGFAFGFVLERVGFGRAPKLMGQFYGYDLAVLKVMFGAVVVAMVGAVVFSGLGLMDWKAVADNATSETFLWPMTIGGFALGVGFVVSGYCPGTSYVSLASGKLDGLVTVVGVTLGQVLWAAIEDAPAIARFQNSSNLGHLYLWELLHLPARVGPAVIAAAVAAMAIGAFVGGERIERIVNRAAPSVPGAPRRSPRGLVFAGMAGFALVGLALGLVPSGTSATHGGTTAIAPLDLARRVLEEPWRVRVVDLRDPKACAEKRIPGSECVPPADLGKLGLSYANPARDLVLVGDTDLQAVPKEALAYGGNLAVLQGGWKGWQAFALEAPQPPGPGASPADLELFRLRAGLQSALTGMKAAPPPPPPTAAPAAPRKGGGGCGG